MVTSHPRTPCVCQEHACPRPWTRSPAPASWTSTCTIPLTSLTLHFDGVYGRFSPTVEAATAAGESRLRTPALMRNAYFLGVHAKAAVRAMRVDSCRCKVHDAITLQRVRYGYVDQSGQISNLMSRPPHGKARSCQTTATPPIGFWRHVMTAAPHHPLSAEPMNIEEPRDFHDPCPISAHLVTHRCTRDRHSGAVAGRVGLAATPPPPSPGQSVTGRPVLPSAPGHYRPDGARSWPR